MGRKVNQEQLDEHAMISALDAAVNDNSARLFDILIGCDLSDGELVRAALSCVRAKNKTMLQGVLAKRDDWAAVEGIGEALHGAATHGASSLARLLVSSGVPVDALDQDGMTPLQAASSREGYELVKFFAARGAKIDHKAESGTFEGWTALHMASLMGDLKMAKLLIDLGADAGMGNKEGLTPLMVRAKSSQESAGQGRAFVDALAAAGADIEAVDAEGYSAAMWAARARNHEVLEALLARGVDKDQTCASNGTSMLEWALACDVYGNRDRCAGLLLEAGVDTGRKVKSAPRGRMISFSELARRNGYDRIHGMLEAKSEAAKIAKSIKVARGSKAVGSKSL